jgi:GNAT superfamily N-acetyltransferase
MAAHTLAVRPEVRGQGIGRSLTNAEFREPCDFSVGVQTSPGGWIATLGGGGEALLQQWVRKPRLVVAHPGAFLRRLLGRKTPPLPQAPEARSLRQSGAEVELIAAFDAGDDAELGRMAARPARVRPLRDAERLNWLYFGTPQLRATRLVLGIRRHGRLTGYAGFRLLPDSLILLECRRLPDEDGAVRTLLAAALHWARARRLSHLLAFAYSTEIDRALPRSAIGAIWRRRFPYAIAIKNDALQESDLELGPWDGDAIFADDSQLFG